MLIKAIADLHGHLIEPSKLKADLVLIAGDICPTYYGPAGFRESMAQLGWLNTAFREWIYAVSKNAFVVAIFGNHDIIAEDSPVLIPKFPWVVLQDDFMVFRKFKIYGSPWTMRYHDWAFNMDEYDLERKWKQIPNDTDILLLHGPPYKIGDLSRTGDFTGSPSLRKRIMELRPALTVMGHIHESRGVYNLGDMVLVNASIRNVSYDAIYEPYTFEIEKKEDGTCSVSVV